MFGLYEFLRYHYNNWRYPPRPMTGFFNNLSEDQKKHVLERKHDV